MTRNEILEILPHNSNSVLVDGASQLHEDGISFTAFANLTGAEPCFKAHFKDELIMPAKDLLEGMAQAAGILFHLMTRNNPVKYGSNDLRYLVGVDKTRFKDKVTPGKRLTYHISHLKTSRTLSKFNCTATVEEKIVAKAILLISS